MLIPPVKKRLFKNILTVDIVLSTLYVLKMNSSALFKSLFPQHNVPFAKSSQTVHALFESEVSPVGLPDSVSR